MPGFIGAQYQTTDPWYLNAYQSAHQQAMENWQLEEQRRVRAQQIQLAQQKQAMDHQIEYDKMAQSDAQLRFKTGAQWDFNEQEAYNRAFQSNMDAVERWNLNERNQEFSQARDFRADEQLANRDQFMAQKQAEELQAKLAFERQQARERYQQQLGMAGVQHQYDLEKQDRSFGQQSSLEDTRQQYDVVKHQQAILAEQERQRYGAQADVYKQRMQQQYGMDHLGEQYRLQTAERLKIKAQEVIDSEIKDRMKYGQTQLTPDGQQSYRTMMSQLRTVQQQRNDYTEDQYHDVLYQWLKKFDESGIQQQAVKQQTIEQRWGVDSGYIGPNGFQRDANGATHVVVNGHPLPIKSDHASIIDGWGKDHVFIGPNGPQPTMAGARGVFAGNKFHEFKAPNDTQSKDAAAQAKLAMQEDQAIQKRYASAYERVRDNNARNAPTGENGKPVVSLPTPEQVWAEVASEDLAIKSYKEGKQYQSGGGDFGAPSVDSGAKADRLVVPDNLPPGKAQADFIKANFRPGMKIVIGGVEYEIQ